MNATCDVDEQKCTLHMAYIIVNGGMFFDVKLRKSGYIFKKNVF